jgi:hypothetical protein
MTTAPEFTATPAPEAEDLFTPPDPTRSRSVPPTVKKTFGKLGNNKKARGGPRALKPDDITRIEDYYHMLAFALMPFKPEVAEAITAITMLPDDEGHLILEGPKRSRICAEAWYELAEQNDAVRRFILMLVESGAWSKLFAANAPILIAALPDDALTRLAGRFMPQSTADAEYIP